MMTPDEMVVEWRKGCSNSRDYPGECPECTDKLIQLLLETIHKRDAAVRAYVDKPGCNVNSRKLAMRRLMWAIGEDYRG